MLKKCKKPDDVLFINAAEHFVKGKRQNQLSEEHITKIIGTYQNRTEAPRYSRRVEMDEITKNDFNLNISRYISTADEGTRSSERFLAANQQLASREYSSFLPSRVMAAVSAGRPNCRDWMRKSNCPWDPSRSS